MNIMNHRENRNIEFENEFKNFNDHEWKQLKSSSEEWYIFSNAIKNVINAFVFNKNYAIVTRRSKTNKKKKIKKIWIECDKETKCKIINIDQRNTVSRRTECSFICIAQLHNDVSDDVLNDHWYFTIINS